ncbi:MAG TPA: dienelactone hydrolase family protein [Verrucomicrobiae bacterium]
MLKYLHIILLATSLSLHAQETLPGTKPLTLTGDISEQMHQAALRDMDRTIAQSIEKRAQWWKRDVSSAENYGRSIEPNRERLKRILGIVDARVATGMERFGDDANPALVAETKGYRVQQVRWPVLERVTGEGLLLEPKAKPLGLIVVVPDADQTPEQMAGLANGIAPAEQWARRFAEAGFVVVVPTLIDRSNSAAGNPAIMMTSMANREWVHRQAYMMGRHVIGYEVQKVLAAVDWFLKQHGGGNIAVAGYGEGGLIAMNAAAVDTRIKAALVSGYFKSRQQTWSEPLYRNVWGLLREFGDAETASLIAPRGLVVQYSAEPVVDGPPAVKGQKSIGAPGKLTTPAFEEVAAEFQRLEAFVPQKLQARQLVREEGCAALLKMLGAQVPSSVEPPLQDQRKAFDTVARQNRQVKELDDHVQWLLRDSDAVRNNYFLFKVAPELGTIPWNYNLRFPLKNPADFASAAVDYRRQFWEDIIGKLDEPLPALNPRTRQVYDEPKWRGYDVVLDVGTEGFAWGVILLPKDLKPGEKRPVVVCQHGRNGVPSHTILDHKPAYQDYAARLADEGFIVLAPNNLYNRETYYRTLSRKGNTVHASMFSVILRHHEQWLKWLATLPNVDATRIGFYGLSYGGESAVRIPTLLPGYALSICSGDFNDWTRKVASTHDRRSFMFTDEWEMPYFNMGSTFSYAELSYLMFPRPFMVERGHHDGVALDSWVAYEYAKTRWLYAQYGLPDKTQIEYFNGGHAINGEGTFEFLRKFLNWPK